MSNEKFVQALPKVELDLQLEGSIRKETLQTIAEQNDIPETFKHYRQWLSRYEKIEYDRLDETIQTVCRWIQQPDDFARVVYELGTALVKQNVKYAEVGFYPHLYVVEHGMTFEQLLIALNDGRERLERGWGIQLRWIVCTFRSQPAVAEETLRWASSAAARKAGVVGFSLGGRDMAQPIDEYEKLFRTTQRKNIPASCSVALVQQAAQLLKPTRLNGAWRIEDEGEGIEALLETQIPLVTSNYQRGHAGRVEMPLRELYEKGVKLVVGTLMPYFFHTSLTQEYQALFDAGLSVKDVEQVALNAIQASFMPDDEKAKLVKDFQATFATLRDDFHLEA